MRIPKSYSLLSAVAFLGACSESSHPFSWEFAESQEAWQAARKVHNANYVYTTSWQSWTGEVRETTTAVQAGVVVRQEHVTWKRQGKELVTVRELSWTEQTGELNTHGRIAATMDDLYGSCRKILDGVEDGYSTAYFNRDANGFMQSCGVTINGCVDDCSHGVQIDSIVW